MSGGSVRWGRTEDDGHVDASQVEGDQNMPRDKHIKSKVPNSFFFIF